MKKRFSLSLLSLVGAMLLVVAPPAVADDIDADGPDSTHSFPSSSSTVVGSIGFIDDDEVGYFWSAARGDSVTEAFTGPMKIKKAVLDLDVVQNVLNSGAFVEWALSINGKDVGRFRVVEGQLGPVKHTFTFSKINGPNFTVKLRVLNEVPSGQGSHTLRYAGDGPHSIKLKKK
jgi:hypothetical protein